MKSLEDASNLLDETRKFLDCPDCDGLMEEANQLHCGHLVCKECTKEAHHCSTCGEKSGKKHDERQDMKVLCDIIQRLHSTFNAECAAFKTTKPQEKEKVHRLLNIKSESEQGQEFSKKSDPFDQLLERLPQSQPSSDPDPYNFNPSQSTYPPKPAAAKKAKRKTYGRKPLNDKSWDYKAILEKRKQQSPPPQTKVEVTVKKAEVSDSSDERTITVPTSEIISNQTEATIVITPEGITPITTETKTEAQTHDQHEVEVEVPSTEQETKTPEEPLDLSIPRDSTERIYLPRKSAIQFTELNVVLDLTKPKGDAAESPKSLGQDRKSEHQEEMDEEGKSEQLEENDVEDNKSEHPEENDIDKKSENPEENDVDKKSKPPEDMDETMAPPKKKVRREDSNLNDNDSDSDTSSSDSDDGFLGKFLSPGK